MGAKAEMLTRGLRDGDGYVEWNSEIRAFVLVIEPLRVRVLGGTVAEARAELRLLGLVK